MKIRRTFLKVNNWINYNSGENYISVDDAKVKFRGKVIFASAICILIFFIYYLTIQSGIVRSANKEVDLRMDSALQESAIQSTIEGNIIDRNRRIITEAKKVGEVSYCLYPIVYSNIVGYESKMYGASGLRYRYRKELYKKNKNGKGCNIMLTTDTELQKYAYELLGKNVGSIIVLKNKTGEILAMASRNSSEIEFNVNIINKNYEKYANIPNFFYNNAVFGSDAPGSTFKIVTATALIDSGHEDYIYNDYGNYRGIRNVGRVAYGEIGVQKALSVSSNTYFAKVATDIIGGKKLSETMSKYMLGKELKLDFTTLKSTKDFNTFDNNEVAMIGFGQGRQTTTPLNIAMALSANVNDGKMMKPYLIKSIDNNTTKPEVLSVVSSKNTAQKVKKLLNGVAEYYGLGGEYYAKTGTAQIGKGEYNHIYLVAANNEYTVAISLNATKQTSGSLVPISKNLFNYLLKNEV